MRHIGQVLHLTTTRVHLLKHQVSNLFNLAGLLTRAHVSLLSFNQRTLHPLKQREHYKKCKLITSGEPEATTAHP